MIIGYFYTALYWPDLHIHLSTSLKRVFLSSVTRFIFSQLSDIQSLHPLLTHPVTQKKLLLLLLLLLVKWECVFLTYCPILVRSYFGLCILWVED